MNYILELNKKNLYLQTTVNNLYYATDNIN